MSPRGQAMENRLSSIEAQLQGICCRVLSLDGIQRGDNILELGGNSFPIMMAVSMIRGELEVDVSIKDVFEAPTIAQLAEVIASRRATPRPQ